MTSNVHESTVDGGMLIDWDLYKIVDANGKQGQTTACQDSRTVSRLHVSIPDC